MITSKVRCLILIHQFKDILLLTPNRAFSQAGLTKFCHSREQY